MISELALAETTAARTPHATSRLPPSVSRPLHLRDGLNTFVLEWDRPLVEKGIWYYFCRCCPLYKWISMHHHTARCPHSPTDHLAALCRSTAKRRTSRFTSPQRVQRKKIEEHPLFMLLQQMTVHSARANQWPRQLVKSRRSSILKTTNSESRRSVPASSSITKANHRPSGRCTVPDVAHRKANALRWDATGAIQKPYRITRIFLGYLRETHHTSLLHCLARMAANA